MTTSATSSARDNITMRSPFTPSQWQELEHQALIFKYMVSGVAIPPELIYSVKRSLDSSMNTRLLPHQPIGWDCFQVGFGRKADPEPGRCRRTDGKKWRCSKEAYPDSKYCERHMHRGRNRSRKPVEIISSSSSTSSSSSSSSSSSTKATATTLISSSTLLNRNLSMINSTNTTTTAPLMSSEIYQDPLTHHQKSSTTYLNNPYLYPPHQQNKSTYNMISSSGFSSPHDHINNTTNTPHHMFMDSGSCSDKDYRYFHGIKDHQGVVDERDFFPEASGSVRGGINIHHHHNQDSICQPLMTTNPFKGYSHDDHHQSHQFHQSFSHNSKPQHCFVLGTDFNSSTSSATRAPLKIDKEDHDDHDDDETQKPLHHFFGEWPPKNTDSAWLDLASNSRVNNW
ncbi:hypothetical protein QYF36_023887 [Acer negundo]|nr:hypothetical protein QYF36_023887 [Acer negundo]